ncbi:MAG: hypothetical protein AAF403_03945, partial [Pseudomonadota bacterium]
MVQEISKIDSKAASDASNLHPGDDAHMQSDEVNTQQYYTSDTLTHPQIYEYYLKPLLAHCEYLKNTPQLLVHQDSRLEQI